MDFIPRTMQKFRAAGELILTPRPALLLIVIAGDSAAGFPKTYGWT
jgi:hypothetical protein